jgi:hypothetical protein
LAEFAGVLLFAAGYAEGDGPDTTGGFAGDEVAHDADVGFLGEVAVLVGVSYSEEGFERTGVQGGGVRLVDGIARHEGEGDAFITHEDGGLVGAANEALDFDGPRLELVAVFSDLPGRLRLVAIVSVPR